MSLQERTLVVRNFDPEQTTDKLLRELCIQGGPVKNVVIRPDHAFVEYEDVESVGYSKALLDGVLLFGKTLSLEPKMRSLNYYKYTKTLHDYIDYDKHCKALEQAQKQQLQQQVAPFGVQTQLFQPNNFVPFQVPQNQQQAQLYHHHPPHHHHHHQQQQQFPPISQNFFMPAPDQMPRQHNNHDNLRRSRSFNQHNHNHGQFNRRNSDRMPDFRNRRR